LGKSELGKADIMEGLEKRFLKIRLWLKGFGVKKEGGERSRCGGEKLPGLRGVKKKKRPGASLRRCPSV